MTKLQAAAANFPIKIFSSALVLFFVSFYGGLNLQSLIYAVISSVFPLPFLIGFVFLLLAGIYLLFFYALDKKSSSVLYAAAKVAILLLGSGIGLFGRGYFSYSFRSLAPYAAGSIIMAIGFGISVAFVLCIGAWLLYSFISENKNLKSSTPTRNITFVAMVIILNIIAVVHIAGARTVYFWDTAGFWTQSIWQSELLFDNTPTFLNRVLISINQSDYNLLPAIPTTIATALFGPSRLIFVLVIMNLYVVTAFYVLTRAARTTRLAAFAAFLCLPLVAVFSAVGFLDAGGLIFCGVALLVYFGKKTSPATFGVTGLLLAGMFLFRRWYIFWVMGFVVCVVIHQLYLLYIKEQKFKQAAQNLILMGGAFFIPLTVFFHMLVAERLVGVNYGQAYVAYWHPLLQDINNFMRWFGVFPLVAVAAFFVLLLLRKKYIVLFLLGQMIVTFVLFRTVQGHFQQHAFLYVPGFFIILALGFQEIFQFVRAKTKPARLQIILTVAIVLVAAGTHIAPFLHYGGTGKPFYPGITLRTPDRQDLAELLRLADHLDQLSGPEGRIIGVVSSSLLFNGDVLRNLELSLNLPMAQRRWYLADYSHIDGRDILPTYLYWTSYAVVAYPPQTHMRPEDQTLITITAMEIINGTTLGAAYEQLPISYHLDNDITVYIFRRVRAVSDEEVTAFEALFER